VAAECGHAQHNMVHTLLVIGDLQNVHDLCNENKQEKGIWYHEISKRTVGSGARDHGEDDTWAYKRFRGLPCCNRVTYQ